MALSWKVLPEVPNVVVAWDPVLYRTSASTASDARAVFDELRSDPTSPISAGSHDFHLAFWNGGTGNAAHDGFYDRSLAGRPNRGHMVFMGAPPTRWASQPEAAIYLVQHEIGHHWLVSKNWRVAGQRPLTFEAYRAAAIAHELRRGRFRGPWQRDPSAFTQPVILGRGDSHYSPFIQSDDSVMDGTLLRLTTSVSSDLDRWGGAEVVVDTVTPPGERPVDVTTSFSPLDLLAMGIIDASSAGDWVTWVQPRIVGPLGYRMGAFVGHGPGEFFFDNPRQRAQEWTSWYVVFDGTYNVLALYEGRTLKESVQLEDNLPVYGSRLQGVAIRFVRRGDSVRVEYRPTPAYPQWWLRPRPWLLDDPPRDIQSSPWSAFGTEISNIPANDEIVCGAINSRVPERGEARFLKVWAHLLASALEVYPTSRDRYRASLGVPTGARDRGAWILGGGFFGGDRQRGGVYSTGASAFRRDTYRIGGRGRSSTLGDFILSCIGDAGGDSEWTDDPGTDRSIRASWLMPRGDWDAAIRVRVDGVYPTTNLGGEMLKRYVIGKTERVSPFRIRFDDVAVQKQEPPPGGEYRAAVVTMATSEHDVQLGDVQSLATSLKYAQQGFLQSTRGRRSLNFQL